MTDDRLLAIYCLCDDTLRALNHHEDPQRKMVDAEVMTAALSAMLYCNGNFERACCILKAHGYIPNMLSRSRFNRRLHQIKELFIHLFMALGEAFKTLNTQSVYVIDTFPIAVCDNYRIPRSKLYKTEAYRGYIASKKRYFYGVRIHLMVTAQGEPVEFFLAPASFADVSGLDHFYFNLPEGAIVYLDKAYNDYEFEDLIKETENIHLLPMRKKNSKRQLPPYICFLQHYHRKRIETTGSLIERILPKSIHAVTPEGFELKVALFVIAHSVNCAIKQA